jgi:Domain of unknown function (DUF5667)
MKRFSEQLNNKAKTVRLSAEEKRGLRERVVSYMEYHPLPTNTKKSPVEKIGSLYGESVKVITFKPWRALQWSGLTVMVFVASVSFLAEKAVPGDVLYSVKVSFNEEIRGTLTRGSYEKVVWETERLNRRIAEARLLADEGRLTEEMEEVVATAVRTHSNNALKEIENLKLVDKEEATLALIEFDTAVSVQSTTLLTVAGDGEVSSSTHTILATALSESEASTGEVTEEEIPSYDKMLAKVEKETTRAYELLGTVGKTATAEEQDDIKRRLSDIETKVAEAMEVVSIDDMGAKHRLVDALQQTHRLIVFMTNIDVRDSVTVDQIVPVTPTEEERLETVKKQINETKILVKTIENTISSEIPAEVAEKAKFGTDKSSLLLTELELLMSETGFDLASAEAKSLEAYNLAKDSWSLFEALDLPKPEEVPEVPTSVEGGDATATTTATTTNEEVII